MSEKRFTVMKKFDGSYVICDKGKMLVADDCCDLLNKQQATISALKDIFKDIVNYSKWDSEKPYCSLGIAVDRKTYYKIREILNE